MSKYKAVRTEVDGITFASKKEARRYQELKLLLKAGEIGSLTLQPRFPLEAFTNGRTLSGGEVIGEYRGDFKYQSLVDAHGRRGFLKWVVEDVKGFKTPLYRWKKRHVEAQYGIEIREI